jgi:hypothetical protein
MEVIDFDFLRNSLIQQMPVGGISINLLDSSPLMKVIHGISTFRGILIE